jgi:hypothetical protein
MGFSLAAPPHSSDFNASSRVNLTYVPNPNRAVSPSARLVMSGRRLPVRQGSAPISAEALPGSVLWAWLFSPGSSLFPKVYLDILLLVSVQDIFSSPPQRVSASADEAGYLVVVVIKDEQDELIFHIAHLPLDCD